VKRKHQHDQSVTLERLLRAERDCVCDDLDGAALTGLKNSIVADAAVPPMEKLAFTIQEAAKLSSLGQTSIYKAIRDGQLVSRKYGTRTIIRRDDLVSFLTNLPTENKRPGA
jgi:excisionase family DNA binding protein